MHGSGESRLVTDGETLIDLIGSPVEVDWPAHGNEWVDRLPEEIAELTGSPQWKATPRRRLEGGINLPAFELIANGLSTRLVVAPVPRGGAYQCAYPARTASALCGYSLRRWRRRPGARCSSSRNASASS
jgi:hypothetical protein